MEKTYKQGTRFRYTGDHAPMYGQEFFIVRMGKQMALVGLRYGEWWDGPFIPSDNQAVRLSELGADPNDWTEISSFPAPTTRGQ